jgi:hypothetical protein
MINLVRQVHQDVAHSLVEAFTDLGGAIRDKHREVVDLGLRVVEIFDWHDVGVAEAYHVLEDFDGGFPLTANHDVEKGFQACDAHLCVLVDHCCEEGATHVLTEMHELVLSLTSERCHAERTLDNHITGWVHAKSSEQVDKLINVWSQADPVSRANE